MKYLKLLILGFLNGSSLAYAQEPISIDKNYTKITQKLLKNKKLKQHLIELRP